MAYRPFKRQWIKNANIKILSLISALILWLAVVLSANRYTHTTAFRLQITNKPSGWILKEALPEKVDVKLNGVGVDLVLYRLMKGTVTIDLHNRSQSRIIKITPRDIIPALPAELTSLEPVEIVSPESLNIQLDRFMEKEVPITPDLILNPLDGYVQVRPVRLEPDSILISGPQVLVNAINTVVTERLTVDNLMKFYKGTVALQDPEWSTVTYSVSEIQFSVDVQGLGERTMTDIPVRLVNAPENLRFTIVPSTLSLKLRGGVRLLSDLKREDFDVTIDYAHRHRYKERQWPATIKYPPDVTSFTDPTPEFFEVIVER